MTPASSLLKEERNLDGGAVSTKFQIDRTYVDGAPFQWAIETLRNVIQVFLRMMLAGEDTSKVMMAFDFVGVEVVNEDDDEDRVVAVKRRFSNIGTPMDPHTELLPIYSKLNVGGGEDRWSVENLGGSYGMGVRASLLPWTDIMFVTSVPGDGSYAITLRKSIGTDGEAAYVIARPVAYDEDGDPFLAPSDMVKLAAAGEAPFYIRTHEGTMVALSEDLIREDVREHGGFSGILLGRGDYTGHVEYDPMPRKKESSYGILKALTDRFVGGKFPIQVDYAISGAGRRAKARGEKVDSTTVKVRNIDLSDGSKFHYDRRDIPSLSDWTDRADELSTITADAHGTTITTFLLPEEYWHTGSYTEEERNAEHDKTGDAFEYRSDGTYGKVRKAHGGDGRLPFGGQGMVVVQYGDDEMYATKEPGEHRNAVLGSWGVSEERVARSTLLVIRPKIQGSIHSEDWGITQNAARSNITGPNGESLPYSTWERAYRDNFPPKLMDRLRVRPPAKTRDIPDEDVRRLMARVFGPEKKGRKKPPPRSVLADEKDVESGLATGEGEPGDETVPTTAGRGTKSKKTGGSATKNTQTATEKKGGGHPTMKRTPKVPPPPQPRFLTGDEWTSAGYPEHQFVRVLTEGNVYEIVLNGGHRVLDDQIRYYWDDEKEGYFANPARKRIRDGIFRVHGGRSTVGSDSKARGAVLEEIEYVYKYDALATFLGAQKVATDEKGVFSDEAFRAMVDGDTDEEPAMAMTIGLVGVYPQHAQIASRINSLGGRPPRS